MLGRGERFLQEVNEKEKGKTKTNPDPTPLLNLDLLCGKANRLVKQLTWRAESICFYGGESADLPSSFSYPCFN